MAPLPPQARPNSPLVIPVASASRYTRSRASCTRSEKVVRATDRKSTRLNSSHRWISYAVFCLNKRHLPPLLDAVGRLYRDQAASFIPPASATAGVGCFEERSRVATIQFIFRENCFFIAQADPPMSPSFPATAESA